ncbi:MAG: hypothetical protein J5J06_06435 [Phycisphaerae bacterium]|nr:hypothetical protein [Phycisphaerae bacterium]
MNNTLAIANLQVLKGSRFASAKRGEKRCPIELPDDPAERREIIEAALLGEPFTVTFSPEGCEPWRERVPKLQLAAYCPNADGLVFWLGIDLDGLSHGCGGLWSPTRAVRCIASAAETLGLYPACVFARSASGEGWHVFVMLPYPVMLAEGVLGVSALVAAAYDLAGQDFEDSGGEHPHAFQNGHLRITEPGTAGGVELFPLSDSRPRLGWALAIPTQARCPFSGKRIELTALPQCSPEAWRRLIDETRASIPPEAAKPKRVAPRWRGRDGSDPFERLPQRVRDFLARGAAEGSRDSELFVAACSMLGFGIDGPDVEAAILEAAGRCTPPVDERTARAKVRSALRTVRV